MGESEPQGAGEQDTAQVTPLVLGSLATVAVNCAVDPASTVAPAGATETVIAGTVIVAEVAAKGLATEVAVSVSVKSLAGGVPGAVYVVVAPLSVEAGETAPQGAGEQDNVQVTPLLLASFPTVAVNCAVDAASTVAVVGATVTATDGTVIVAEADLVASAAEVAVRVTIKLFIAGAAGAV